MATTILGSCDFEAQYFGNWVTLATLPRLVGAGESCLVGVLDVQWLKGRQEIVFLEDSSVGLANEDGWWICSAGETPRRVFEAQVSSLVPRVAELRRRLARPEEPVSQLTFVGRDACRFHAVDHPKMLAFVNRHLGKRTQLSMDDLQGTIADAPEESRLEQAAQILRNKQLDAPYHVLQMLTHAKANQLDVFAAESPEQVQEHCLWRAKLPEREHATPMDAPDCEQVAHRISALLSPDEFVPLLEFILAEGRELLREQILAATWVTDISGWQRLRWPGVETALEPVVNPFLWKLLALAPANSVNAQRLRAEIRRPELRGDRSVEALARVDVSPISTLEHLDGLEVSLCREISGWSEVAPRLTELHVSGSDFANWHVLGQLSRLEKLNLAATNVDDLSWLPALAGLRELCLWRCPRLTDLGPLVNVIDRLSLLEVREIGVPPGRFPKLIKQKMKKTKA